MAFNNFGFVVNYCSNEKEFIDKLLNQLSRITTNIAICYADKLYDGTPEDTSFIEDTIKAKYMHINLNLVKYNVDPTINLYNMPGVVNRPTTYWPNLARCKGSKSLCKECEFLFFIDADEIPEADTFISLLSENKLEKDYVYQFANYWYFKSPCNQATTYEDSIVCIHTYYLQNDDSLFFHDNERHGLVDLVLEKKGLKHMRMVVGIDRKPIFHHFSWVRSKEGIATKLRTWTHRDDIFKNANIDHIIAEIYKDDNVNDIVHHYQYNHVENIFDIMISD